MVSRSLYYTERVILAGLLLLTAFLLKHADLGSSWRIGFLLICVLGLVHGVRRKELPWTGTVPEVKQLALAWGIFVLIVSATSLAGSVWEQGRIELLRDFLMPALIPFLLLAYFRTPQRWRMLLGSLVVAVLIAMVRNFIQYIHEWLSLGLLSSNINLHRHYSESLVFGLPILLLYALTVRQAALRAIGWCLIILLLVMILGTGARGAWLGAVVVFAVFLIGLRDRRFTLIVGGASILALVLAVFLVPPELLGKRVEQGLDTSLRTTGTWGPALDMIVERPVLGFGFGGDIFHSEFNKRAPTAAHWSVKQSIGPHNFFLALFFAAGALGLLSLLAVLILVIRRLVGQLRKRVDDLAARESMALSGVALLAMVSGSYFAIGMVETSNWHLFGYWLGLSMAWLQLTVDQPSPPLAPAA